MRLPGPFESICITAFVSIVVYAMLLIFAGPVHADLEDRINEPSNDAYCMSIGELAAVITVFRDSGGTRDQAREVYTKDINSMNKLMILSLVLSDVYSSDNPSGKEAYVNALTTCRTQYGSPNWSA